MQTSGQHCNSVKAAAEKGHLRHHDAPAWAVRSARAPWWSSMRQRQCLTGIHSRDRRRRIGARRSRVIEGAIAAERSRRQEEAPRQALRPIREAQGRREAEEIGGYALI